MFWRRNKEPKAKYTVGQDVIDSQDEVLGQIASVHENYIEIGMSNGKQIYVPMQFISGIPRGEAIAVTVSKAQVGIRDWDKPPQ